MPLGIVGAIIDYETRHRGLGRSSIQFLYFDAIDSGAEANYDEQMVRGRSEEHVFYSHTTGESDSFSIKLPASTQQGDEGDAKKTWQDFLFIKSFSYPDYDGGLVLPPRKAIITIGQWYQKVGVIKGLAYTFSQVCDEDGYPHVIDVRFQFRVIHARALGMRDIRAMTKNV